jgi:hypothetical protein
VNGVSIRSALCCDFPATASVFVPHLFPNTAARQSRNLTGFPHHLLFEVVSAIFNGREHLSIFQQPQLVVLNDNGDFPARKISVNMPQITIYSTRLYFFVNMQALSVLLTCCFPSQALRIIAVMVNVEKREG